MDGVHAAHAGPGSHGGHAANLVGDPAAGAAATGIDEVWLQLQEGRWCRRTVPHSCLKGASSTDALGAWEKEEEWEYEDEAVRGRSVTDSQSRFLGAGG